MSNQKEKARSAFRQALILNPDRESAFIDLAEGDPSTNDIAFIKASYDGCKPGSPDRSWPAIALGKISEQNKQYEAAFDFFLEGNAARRATFDYSTSENRQKLDSAKSIFNKQFIEKNLGGGTSDKTPIFILGMPRSGTSLTEQILFMHPDVHGAGERNYFRWILQAANIMFLEGGPAMDATAKLNKADLNLIGTEYVKFLRAHHATSQHITDKMPGNFWYLGLIRLVLPNARIIHCRRNPVDNCISIFKSSFVALHRYAHDLEELGQYYRIYDELMQHWQSVLPDQSFLTVQYEEMVADPERQIRTLPDYCNLEYHPDCLNFHKSKRIVKTASRQQVRRPIYKTSINTADRYGDKVKPLLDALSSNKK